MDKVNCLKKMFVDRQTRKKIRSEQCQQDKYVDDMVFSDSEDIQSNQKSFHLDIECIDHQPRRKTTDQNNMNKELTSIYENDTDISDFQFRSKSSYFKEEKKDHFCSEKLQQDDDDDELDDLLGSDEENNDIATGSIQVNDRSGYCTKSIVKKQEFDLSKM